MVTKQTDYTYDALDRRIKKVHDPDGSTGSARRGHREIRLRRRRPVPAVQWANGLTNRYLHGPAVDQVLAVKIRMASASAALELAADGP